VNPVLVALDVDRAARALDLADRLRGAVGGYKIGHQLFSAEGPPVVRALVDRGDRVFLDLKYHDIPNTVAGAVAAAAALGVWMVNVHASGGRPMMEAARRAANEAAGRAGRPGPLVIAVTVLTSMDADTLQSVGVAATPLDQAVTLARLAQDAGLDGVVTSPLETAAIRRACGPGFVIVTPGIRGGTAASAQDDQQRTGTPAGALAAGSSYLVIGRPITAAADPRAAAAAIARDVTGTKTTGAD
jgi:orotidine-5'-phosphate decarboxylase